MAYQPKSYKKFVATAATATLVASAVAPAAFAADFTDVTGNYKEAVDFVVSKGVNGTSATTFGTSEAIKRVDAAVMLAAVLGLDTEKAPAGGFTDVPERAVGAVNALKAAGITSGKTATTFDANANITRGELAIWITNGFKLKATSTSVAFTDVTDRYKAAVTALVDNKVTSGVSETAFGTNANAKRGDFAIFLHRAANAQPAKVEVSKSAATGSKKLEVTFKAAVADTSKAVFTVKKGSSTIGVAKTTWSEDKKVATLELSSKLSAGDYNISVSGLSEAALTTAVKAENERVDTITISEQLVSNDATYDKTNIETATASYTLKNQYGEDVTKVAGLSSVTNAFDVVSSTGTANFNNGLLTWTASADVNVKNAEDSPVVITFVNKVTSKPTTATLKLAAKSKIATWDLGGLFQIDSKTPSEDNTTGFSLLLNAKDQYGNALTSAADLNGKYTVISSNPGVVAVTNTIVDNIALDKNDATKKGTGINLTIAGKGTAVITVVENATATPKSFTVTVDEGVKVDVVTLGTPEGVVAGGETVKVPLEVTNNKGEAVTKESDIEAGITVTASQNGDAITIGAPQIKVTDGKAYLEFTTAAVAANQVENLVINVTTATNKVATKTIQVKENAVAKTLVGLKSTVAKSIYRTASYNLDSVVVEDQHGRTMTTAQLAGYKLVIEDFDADATGAVEITGDATVNSRTKGSELVKFKLVKTADASEVSTFDTTLTTVVASDFTSYEVAPVETLYYDGTAVDAKYGEKFVVNGITAGGEKVALTNGTDYELSLPAGVALAADGKLYATKAAVGVDAVNTGEGASAKPESAEFDGKVTLNINDGRDIAFKVSVSAVAPKVAEFKLEDADKKAVDTVTFAGAAVTGNDIVDLFEGVFSGKDQYGMNLVKTGATVGSDIYFADGTTKVAFSFKVVSREDKGATTLTVANNGSSSLSVTNLEAGDSFTVEVTAGSVTKTIKVKR